MIRFCKHCGKNYKTPPSRALYFCSIVCFGLAKRLSDNEKIIRRAESVRKFRVKNRLKLNEIARQKYKQTNEKIKERKRINREKNREKYRAYSRNFYWRNADKRRAERRDYTRALTVDQLSIINKRRRERWNIVYMNNIKKKTDPATRMRVLVGNAKCRSKKRGFSFDPRILDDLLENPRVNCECCGKKLNYTAEIRPQRGGDDSPSLDRIDNDRGYVKGNVAVICCKCNWAKGQSSIDDLTVVINYMKRHLDPFVSVAA